MLHTTDQTLHGTPGMSPNRDIMTAEASIAASLFTHMPITTVKAHLRRQENKAGAQSDTRTAPATYRLKQPQVVNIGYITSHAGKGQGKHSFNIQRELLKQRLKDTKKFRQFFEPSGSSYEKSTKLSTAQGRRIASECASPSELSRPVEVPLSLAHPQN